MAVERRRLFANPGPWLIPSGMFVATYGFVVRPNPTAQLFVMLGTFAAVAGVLVLALVAFATPRAPRLRTTLFAAATIVAVLAGGELGATVRARHFASDASRYDAAAAWAGARARANDTVVILEIPAQYADLAYAIHVHDDADCGRIVDFFWGRGFPVRHVVRRYQPRFSRLDRCRTFIDLRSLPRPGWYEYSD